MGLEPFNLAAALNCLTAQRLLRKICTECKVETTYTEEFLNSAKIPLDWVSSTTQYKGEGCDACDGTGFKGRQGLYEVLLVNSAIRKAIMANLGTDEIRDVALGNGMLTLRMDGLKKVERGATTLEEVVKETSNPD
jgi:type IV pilus assembly protein PilB